MTPCRVLRVWAAALSGLLIPASGWADEQNPEYLFPGPYRAEVVRVIDGDTIVVNVELWPDLTSEVSARVRGIDAPELSSSDCETAALLGQRAKGFVEDRYGPGDIVQLRDIGPDSFSGRVVADIRRWRSDRWLPLRKELLDSEPPLAVEWEPGQSDVPWCLLTKEP